MCIIIQIARAHILKKLFGPDSLGNETIKYFFWSRDTVKKLTRH